MFDFDSFGVQTATEEALILLLLKLLFHICHLGGYRV